MSIKLRRLKIPEELLDRLAKKEIRFCKDVLSRPAIEIQRMADCSYSQLKSLLQACSEAVSPKVTNALVLKDDSTSESSTGLNYLPTSLPALDQCLRGGLPLGKISEITGPSGCGKTQFCLMLSALVPSNVGGGVIYIDTEGAFSAQRLLEILQARYPQLDPVQLENRLKHVHVINAYTCALLMNSLDSIEELVITHNVKLILIDSVASLMLKEFSSASLSIIERTNLLTKIASMLKYAAEFFRIPVVTANQTVISYLQDEHVKTNQDKVDEDEDKCLNDDLFDTRGQGELIAALGNTWTHSVNTRLILQYLPQGGAGVRQILIAKSPVSAFGAVSYRIESSGIVQIGDRAVHYEGTDPGLQKIQSKGQFPSIPT